MSWRKVFKILWADISPVISEDEFWAFTEGKDSYDIFIELVESELDPDVIKAYERTFIELVSRIREKYPNERNSGFTDFIYSVIAKGKEVYYEVLNGNLDVFLSPKDPDIGYVFTQAWEAKTGKEFQYDWED